MPILEVFILDIILFIFNKDKKMRAIVVKNFETHGNKNLKASMMFMITIGFLIFTSSNFK